MPDENKDLMLERMTNERLPAIPESGEREPSESLVPTEDRDVRGRSSEEVVGQPREERQYTETEPEEVSIPASPKKRQREVKKYDIDGRLYTKEELEDAGLIDRVIQTARQMPTVQRRYAELLKEREAAAARTEEAPAAPSVITNLAIAKTYDDIARIIANDLIANKLLDEELGEIYPRAVLTMIGQMRFAFDEIFQQKDMLRTAIQRLESTIAWLNAGKAQVEGQAVAAEFNRQLDALVAKDAKLFGALKDRSVRDAFTRFLVNELEATVEQCTGRRAEIYLSKQWIAHNAEVIMEATKKAQADKQKRQDRRFVTGESGGSRPGVLHDEPDLLNRMIENSGRIRE
jgi:hypothetical protein